MSKSAEMKTCFVISRFGDEGSEIRKQSDQVLNLIIKRAAERSGYIAIRSDEVARPGVITDDIIDHLRDDPLVIADLTGQNANVFYELAIRHMVRKPVISIIIENENPPFDVAQLRTIKYELTLQGGRVCEDRIVAAIQEIERDPENIHNPISRIVDLRALTQSHNLYESNFAQVVAALGALSSEVSGLTSAIFNSRTIVSSTDTVLNLETYHYLSECLSYLEGELYRSRGENNSIEKWETVVREIVDMLEKYRGDDTFSAFAEEAFEDARKKLRDLLSE